MNSSPIRIAAKTASGDIDEIVAAKVAKATALAEKLGPKGFVKVTPPHKLCDKVKLSRNPKFDPIEAAEKNLKRLSSGFKLWIQDDLSALKRAFNIYTNDPSNVDKLQSLNHAIHTIKGNASILGCEAAGLLACPLTNLLEGCSDYAKMQPVLALAVSSICHAMETNVPIDDPVLLDTINVLSQLKSSCQKSKVK